MRPKHDDVLTSVKSMLRLGDTLVPIMFMSDGMHLSNFAGNTKQWPVYMPIGNLSSKIYQIASMQSFVIVALLSILINNGNIHQNRLDEQQQKN